MVLCTSLVDFVATIKTDLNFCKIPSFLTPIETEEINRDWDGFGIQSCTTHCTDLPLFPSSLMFEPYL